MATLSDHRLIVFDATGARVNGGKLRLYNTGTTTLSSVFSDAALGVALTNPVVADSLGVLPQIYAAAGLAVDCVKMTAAEVIIPGTAFTATFAGSVSSGQSYDFGNSRLALSGEGGVVQVEFGDPTGDDAGGSGRIGGWDGTQADSIELDAAETNTTGTFTENSKQLPGVVETEGSASGAATVIIALSNLNPVGCRLYEIDLIDIVSQNAVALTMAVTVSVDNGANYIAAGYYSTRCDANRTAPTSAGSANASSASILNMAGAAVGTYATMTASTPNGSGDFILTGRFAHRSSDSTERGVLTDFAVSVPVTARVTHIKLTAGGTIACTYRVRPQRGLGE